MLVLGTIVLAVLVDVKERREVIRSRIDIVEFVLLVLIDDAVLFVDDRIGLFLVLFYFASDVGEPLKPSVALELALFHLQLIIGLIELLAKPNQLILHHLSLA